MQTISKSQLQRDIKNREDMLLINVLSRENFNQQHIPSSINIPLKDNANFVNDVEAQAQSKDQRIVIYCASTTCDASEHAAQKLEEAGFTNIECFKEGVEGWFGPRAAAA